MNNELLQKQLMFYDIYIPQFGVVKQIISDNSKTSTSAEFENFVETMEYFTKIPHRGTLLLND